MTYAAHVHALMLQELGGDVTVITPATVGAGPTERHNYKTRQFDVSGSGMPWNPIRGDIKGVVDFTELDRPDLVIAEGWFTPGAILLPRLAKFARHLVLASHGAADLTIERATPMHVARSLAYRWEERTRSRRLMRLMSAAIVLSDYEDRYRFRDVAVFRQRGVPLYVCPNVSTYTPSNGHPLRDIIEIIHIGEMKPHKNQEAAIRAVASLPTHYRLTLAFPIETDYLREVLRLAAELKVLERIRLLSGRTRSELETRIEESDLLLITSPAKDVQPIVAVDALAKGLPFVSTDVGCMRNLAGGVVARVEDLGAAIAAICGSPDAYRDFSKQACVYRDSMLLPSIAKRSLAKMLSELGIG